MEQRKNHRKRSRRYAHQKKRRRMPFLMIALLVADLILVCAAGRCMHHFFGELESAQSDAYNVFSRETDKNSITDSEGSNNVPAIQLQGTCDTSEFAEKCRQLYEENKDLLILVNKDYALPENYRVDLTPLQNKRESVADVMYDDLREMLGDAIGEGYSYALVSGYRDSDYQQTVIERDVQKYMRQGMSRTDALEKTYEQVMPAGHSEHETGLALDITVSQNTALDETQANEPGIIWLHENCWKYGFILRYPQDKEEITQISYEPWHFRYVGHETAEFLYKNNLTLEEFYEYLN